MKTPLQISLILSVLMISKSAFAGPQASAILKAIDDNQSSTTAVSTTSFTIHGARGSRTIKSRSWSKGSTASFTEYLAPAREKGTKMLKRGDQLWTFYPQADRIVKIAGHLLRRPVMGSDLSYEDFLEQGKLIELYNAKVIGKEKLGERSVWLLELTAKAPSTAYQKRRLWVDSERHIPLKEERFAASGKLLRTTEIRKVERLHERWVPTLIWFKDALKSGKGTEFHVHDIQYDVPIPDTRFSKSALRR